MNTFIYALIDPRNNKIRYIGKANNPYKRFPQHINEAKNSNTKKANWIKSLIKNLIRPELLILDEVEKNNWQFWEKFYISLYKSWGFDLTNVTEGGGAEYEYSLNRPMLAETKLKKSISMKEYWSENSNTEFRLNTNKKISKTVKEQSVAKWTPELRKKSSESAIKKFVTGYKNKGAILWKEKGLNHPQFKPLAKYNLNCELVNEFYTVESLVEDYGSRTAYTGCCKYHDIKKSYFYRYINPTETDLPNTIESVKESIFLYLKRKQNRKEFMKKVQKQRWVKLILLPLISFINLF